MARRRCRCRYTPSDQNTTCRQYVLKHSYYWILIFDKMEIERSHLGGSVEHSKGKSGESVVAILRFLCGSPCLCQLRTDGLVPVSKY
jgi:hypothetical protein